MPTNSVVLFGEAEQFEYQWRNLSRGDRFSSPRVARIVERDFLIRNRESE